MCFNSKSKGFPTIEDYKTESKIGEGANSKVFKVTNIKTNKTQAAKVIKVHAASSMARALQEVEIMKQLQHENLVELIDVKVDYSAN